MTRTTIRSEDITAGQVKSADLASDAVDTTGIQTDIAILGFKVAANGSLAKYDLVDQTIDDFQDASGVDASASTDEVRNASNYYSGTLGGSTTGHTATGTWAAPAAITSISILAVAGGGGGGSYYYAGGGGAGGVMYIADHSVTGGNTYNISIGAGGSGGSSSNPGGWGVDTTFSGTGTTTVTAKGGGGGGAGASGSPSTNENGRDGGSGGGSSGYNGVTTGGATVDGSPSSIQLGNAGGGNNGQSGGGGGGAGGAGGSTNGITSPTSTANTGGNGGAGYNASAVFGTTWGVSGVFAGGGGASSGYNTGTADNAGQGAAGGGNGAWYGASAATSATANTGSGGGGGSHLSSYPDGADGGSGIVLIKEGDIYNDMTLISNATTAEAVPTKGDLVMTYTNGAGTATVNTDIKGWVSRDNGVTYTQFTLADEGDTGGHTILTAHDLDISGQPSGTAMRYKITTHNQSASKETRIQAVSLGWS